MVYDVWAQKLPSLLEDGSLCHDCSAVVRLCSHSPAKAVGGDLYDFFVRDNELVFCVGDYEQSDDLTMMAIRRNQ